MISSFFKIAFRHLLRNRVFTFINLGGLTLGMTGALFIAAPLVWLVMKEWLENFAYRIDIEWWMFALPAFISIAIALFTISLQSIRAALSNPVKSLRAE